MSSSVKYFEVRKWEDTVRCIRIALITLMNCLIITKIYSSDLEAFLFDFFPFFFFFFFESASAAFRSSS
jgi:hypothetical protein